MALAGLEVAKLKAPEYQNWVAAAFIVGVVLTIASYYLHFWTEAVGPLQATLAIIGQESEVDVYYVKSTDPRDSRPLEGFCLNPACDFEWNVRKGAMEKCPKCGSTLYFSRFETKIYCVEEYDFPELFPEAGPGYVMFFRHWKTWEERVHTHGGVAIKGGIPFWHNHHETIMVKPLDAAAFMGPEGYKQYPTFEIWGTMGGDASQDFEPMNEGWKNAIRVQKKGGAK